MKRYQETLPSLKVEIEQEPEYELIDVEVYFDFQPEEPMTRHYPGCDASCDIYAVHRIDNDAELCLLPKVQEEIEEQILCAHYDEMMGGDPRW